jgi:hypothetical protein
MRSTFSLLCVGLLLQGAAAHGATVNLTPSQDTTIISENDNSNALGALFAGETATGNLRRALLQFDVASAIPSGATITSVSLSITQVKIGPGSAGTFELLPLGAAWGEGTSAGSGSGSPATPGDATWNFRIYDSDLWDNPGGDFGEASGSAFLAIDNATYTFNSQPGMVNDVQTWLNFPSQNFGWILRAADESPGQTSAREFLSRESQTGRPLLSITYSSAAVPEPGSLLLLAAGTGATMLCGRRSRPRQASVP